MIPMSQKLVVYEKETGKVRTGKFRLSYPAIFVKKAMDAKSEAKYSATFLIPKTDTETYNALKALATDTAMAKWGGNVPPGLKLALKDGDKWADEYKAKGKNHDEMRGHWVVRTSTSVKPGAAKRGENGRAVDATPEDIYGGCYCCATVTAYAWSNSANGSGVSFNLNNIYKLEDGEPFSAAASSPTEDFDGIVETATGAPSTAPQQPAKDIFSM